MRTLCICVTNFCHSCGVNMMGRKIFFVVHLIVSLRCAKIINQNSCSNYPCLIFDEEFVDLDYSTWTHMRSAAETGNQEFQYYTNNRTNSFVRDGVLYLKPTLTTDRYGQDDFLTSGTLDLWGRTGDTCTSNLDNIGCFRTGTKENIINPIQSAGITTANSFSFKYGKLEVRAKMPLGDWLWPAVWLMPKHSEYGKWPASGEIDLFESRGNLNLKSNDGKDFVGVQRIQQSLHWGPFYPLNGHSLTVAKTNKQSGTFADDFRTFSLTWSDDSISFYINQKLTMNVTANGEGFWKFGQFNNLNNIQNPWISGTKMAPFDKEFCIRMNLAVGGTNDYFHRLFTPKIPWNNDDGLKAMTSFWEARDQWFPSWKGDDSALKIDYVKVWKLEP